MNRYVAPFTAPSLLAALTISTPSNILAADSSLDPSAPSPRWWTMASVDVNEVDMKLTNFGHFGFDIHSSDSGLIYPRGSDRTCLFGAGLWLGGQVAGEARVTVSEYLSEFQPGVVVNGSWLDPELPRFRVYQLTPDSGPGDPDYDEWPVQDGAPLGRDGQPLRVGAKTCFSVFNDANPARHYHESGSTAPWPAQIRHLTWAYDLPAPFDRAVLHEWCIQNAGQDPILFAFAALWADVDMGFSRDDLPGCDPALRCAFTYNATSSDSIYPEAPPATGLAVLRGFDPENSIYASVDWWNGQDPWSYEQSYRLMRGFSADGYLVEDPTTGEPTRYWHAGDPLTGEGWLATQADDQRNMMSVGPVNFAPGQERVLRAVLMVGQGSDHLDSVRDLKQSTRALQDLEARGAFPEIGRWAIGGVYPSEFDPNRDPVVRSFVAAPTAGTVRVEVRDANRSLIRGLAIGLPVTSGLSPIEWDGLDDKGSRVSPGGYEFWLHVSRSGNPTRTFVADHASFVVTNTLFSRAKGTAERSSTLGAVPGATYLLPLLSSRDGIVIRWSSPTNQRPVGSHETSIAILDVAGRRVFSAQASPPQGTITWDGRSSAGALLPSGMYFVRLTTSAGLAVRRGMLLRR